MFALLVDLGWKSALVAGTALLANHLLWRRPPGERVALLRAAVATLLMLPLLALAVPELELAVLPVLEAAPTAIVLARPGVAGPEVADAGAGMSFDWLPPLYFAGAGLFLLRLGAGLFMLWRWTRLAAPVRDPHWIDAMRLARLRRPVRLLVSPRVAAPISWGVVPAWVLISPGTERRPEQAEAVIAHELAHVRRFDWPVLIVAQLVTLAFWFNPLVWLLGRELARQTELAADEEAVGQVARADYAQALLVLAGGSAHPAACGMSITHSALARRICSVLDANAARPSNRLVCAVMLACAPLAAAPLAAMQLVHATPSAPAGAVQSDPAAAASTPRSAIISIARVAEVPAAQRSRTILRRTASTRAPRPGTPDIRLRTAPQPDEAEQFGQHHAGLITPPRPPAPGTEAAAWQEALSRNRAQTGARPRNARMRRALAEAGTAEIDDRALAIELAGAAKGLRIKAQDLEAVAANGSVVKEIRDAHARAAGSLRNQADQLDKEARRKLGG